MNSQNGVQEKVSAILAQMTLEEKCLLLTGDPAKSLSTANVERLGVEAKRLADGPHGERNYEPGTDSTAMPSMCALGATWNTRLAELEGETIARDCIHHDISMILGPGLNMKRNALNGRNFEYVSEDPVLTGEIAGSYVKGCEETGVGTSMKHFACNSQETRRTESSAEIDERTMREIYLRAFEIAVKKGNPASIMCAYNKINSIWCSENKYLLNDIPRNEWGYQNIMISDWGAVHDGAKAVHAGLDLRMSGDPDEVEELKRGLEEGTVTMEDIDKSASRVLAFLLREKKADKDYDRARQHENATNIAREAITVLKNNKMRDGVRELPIDHSTWKERSENLLPLTPDKVKRICVTGEYAVMPYINGQGSAEVFPNPEHIDNPVECLKELLPGVEVDYMPYLTRKQPDNMLWHVFWKGMPDMHKYDAVLVFAGVQPSQDSENIDRFDNRLAGYIEDVLRNCTYHNPNVILVLTSGSSTFRSDKADACSAIVQQWPAGEGTGRAIAEVLTGKVNPSGKLSETFPVEMRHDIDLEGDGLKVDYAEKWAIGYRYYDLHPEKIWFPFGHGLSYTTFEYGEPTLTMGGADGAVCTLKFSVKNTGRLDGAEAVQIYVGDPVSTCSKPVKELKAFDKVFLKAGESKELTFKLGKDAFSYYNTMLRDWVIENGRYDIYVAASSRDIRHMVSFVYDDPKCYTMQKKQEDMIG